MKNAMPDSELIVSTVTASEKTTWIFFVLSGADGGAGVGEATVSGRAADVLAGLSRATAAVDACPFGPAAKGRAVMQAVDGVVGRAIASGLEQAWLDREGKRTGRPVAALLGGAGRHAVPAYANINRGASSRSAREFADRAAAAHAQGYGAVKLAPFDGVGPAVGGPERDALIDAGFDRVAAVAERVGGRVRIQVDCHSRFTIDEAPAALDRLADLGVVWFEEPVRETAAALPALADVRRMASARGVLLVGAENVAGLEGLAPVLAARCYDVVMPDIILSGGPLEVMRMGHLAAALGAAVSLHNPCGPIMDAHSLHAAMALPTLHSMERQVDETALYEDIVDRAGPGVSGGVGRIGATPGLGVSLKTGHPAVREAARHRIAF